MNDANKAEIVYMELLELSSYISDMIGNFPIKAAVAQWLGCCINVSCKHKHCSVIMQLHCCRYTGLTSLYAYGNSNMQRS